MSCKTCDMIGAFEALFQALSSHDKHVKQSQVDVSGRQLTVVVMLIPVAARSRAMLVL